MEDLENISFPEPTSGLDLPQNYDPHRHVATVLLKNKRKVSSAIKKLNEEDVAVVKPLVYLENLKNCYDGLLLPCLVGKKHYFYTLNKKETKRHKFGRYKNEIVINIDLKTNLIIVRK